ncbi:hypothetical protein ACFQ60_19420 [Streptomyces zhihengii]
MCAPLLAGPLTRLLASRSSLGDSGLRVGDAPAAQVWLVAVAVAVCCAAAVVAPALGAGGEGPGGAVAARCPARCGPAPTSGCWPSRRSRSGSSTGRPGPPAAVR